MQTLVGTGIWLSQFRGVHSVAIALYTIQHLCFKIALMRTLKTFRHFYTSVIEATCRLRCEAYDNYSSLFCRSAYHKGDGTNIPKLVMDGIQQNKHSPITPIKLVEAKRVYQV